MRRAIHSCLGLAILSSCSSLPGLGAPRVDLGGYLAAYRLRGRARMQSVPSGGGRQDNAAIDLEDFALGDRDDDVGAFLSIGDGISGFDLHFLKIRMQDTSPGVLTSDFGSLREGEAVITKVVMDEFRARYVACLPQWEPRQDLRLTAGAGAVVAHRDLKFFPKRADASGQLLEIGDDGVAYAAGRVRGSYRDFSLTFDWAWSDDWTFGGEFDGTLQDFEITARYDLELQDAAIFAGYRRSELPAAGHVDHLAYATDFRLDGFFVGGAFRF